MGLTALTVVCLAPLAATSAMAGHFQTLYRFRAGATDAGHPTSALVAVNGVLYGTTIRHGASNNGTFYSVTHTGSEQLLYSFAGGTDGAAPYAPLLNVGGTLYGTTRNGGSNVVCHGGLTGCGTVFSITTAGAETVLHIFQSSPDDGEEPVAPLIEDGGLLYGVTELGGAKGVGGVFSITPTGTETPVYSFSDRSTRSPGSLVVHGAKFYGTAGGGDNSCGCGTIYSLTAAGKLKTLYDFTGGSDGDYPNSMTWLHGAFYGTANGQNPSPDTVFSVTTKGAFTTVHSFGTSGDGEFPGSGQLVVLNGLLYGTTFLGGAYGYGIIYSIAPDGTEVVEHSFDGKHGGANPDAGLTVLHGTLYGNTYSGGNGYGIVFAYTP